MITSTDSPAPAPEEHEVEPEVTRGKKPQRYLTVDKIALALIEAKGDRGKACHALGISREMMNTRIYKSPELKSRFGHKAMLIRAKVDQRLAEATATRETETVSIFESQMESFAVGQGQLASRLMERLVEVQDRLSRGNKARELANKPESEQTPEDKSYIKTHAFQLDTLKNPVEERMLLNQEIALTQEYTRIAEACASISLKNTQMRTLMKKFGGKTKPGSRMLAAPPKGAAPGPRTPPMTVTRIENSQVVINPPPNERGQ